MASISKTAVNSSNNTGTMMASAAPGHHADSVSKAIAHDTAIEQSGESGKSFDYSQSIKTPAMSIPEQQIPAYLSKIQRGSHIQPFGCLMAVDESTFRVIAYSENARDLLDLTPQSVPSIEKPPEALAIGTDVRTLFMPSSGHLLEKAFRAREITLLNPLWIHSKNAGKPFYAILHRIDVGIVIDLEPAGTEDPALSGAVQSQKLALRAISQLQSLPGGDIQLLCDTVVKSVRELTGYDRVMVYKFHEDEHGEVVAECKRPELEAYIGRHYPATDIPQASRFLFKQNRVRMIVDCHAKPVRVVQDEAIVQPLCLVRSTLRAAHECHALYMANMGTTASLAMAVIVNGNDEEGDGGRNSMRLWGLVVCHHTSARCIPFPLRYACEFLMQAFGLQLNMELQLASQLSEKHVLKTQTLLCDREMDELSSDAREMVRLIETATAPIFSVDIDGRINGWNAKIAELTGLLVEDAMGKSLVHDLVYEESKVIVDKLLSNALRGEEDKNVEIKLKTIPENDNKAVFVVVNACSSKDYTNNVVGVYFVGQDVTGQKVVMDNFIDIQADYKAIVHSPNPLIPPIFAADNNSYRSGWNTSMEKLSDIGYFERPLYLGPAPSV